MRGKEHDKNADFVEVILQDGVEGASGFKKRSLGVFHADCLQKTLMLGVKKWSEADYIVDETDEFPELNDFKNWKDEALRGGKNG